jgi:hypothetical protein
LIQLLIWQIIKPERAMIMGGTYKIPVLVKLLYKDFIRDLKMDGTFNDAAFEREYLSRWSGTVEDAFFNSEAFDRNRVLKQPEYEYSGRSSKSSYYILAVDVARSTKGCDSIVCVFKVIPQPQAAAIKSLVNIYNIEADHFES